MSDDDQAEKLELHNLVSLAQSAREKLKNKKPLTKREIAAVAELERRQQPAQTVDARAAMRLIVDMQPTVINEPLIRGLFGDLAANSLTDIANVFGVSVATVRHTWRPNGMPAEGKRGSGSKIMLAEVVIWLLNRSKTNQSARGQGETSDRKRDAEIRKVEAEAQLRELAVEKKEGEYISVIWAKSVIAAKLGIIRDGIMSIGRELMNDFPRKQAVEARAKIDRKCETILNAVANDLLEEIDQRKEESSDVESSS